VSRPIDPDELQAKVRQVFGYLEGALVSGMIYLGDQLGLYRALDGAGALTSEELAERTGLDERWVREWLRGQGAAGLLDHADGRFSLSAEGAAVLADEQHPAFSAGGFGGLPAQLAVLPRLPEAFRTGRGLPYDAFGPEGNIGVERSFAPWYRTLLVPLVLPKLEGVVPKLEAGCEAADVGCGTGVAVLELARAFPSSRFHGYEISEHALERAERNRAEAGVENVTFHDARSDPLPDEPRFDLVTTFDCIHDMAHPQRVIAGIRRALADDGTWFLADIKAKESYEENVEHNPMAALMYGFSVLSCMSSALSEPDGMGLGTLGLHEGLARELAEDAGFTRFRRCDIDHPMNAYYEIRP